MFAVKVAVFKVLVFCLEIYCSAIYVLSFALLPLTKAIVQHILRRSDIDVNGTKKSDPQVNNDRFYCCIAQHSYSGIVDAYANGYFECEDLRGLFVKIEKSYYYKTLCYHPSLYLRSLIVKYFYTQTEAEVKDIDKSYDKIKTSEEKEEECAVLSTAYFKNTNDLKEAMTAKSDLIARKLYLKPGMRVLDIGCGDGGLCKHLAKNYDAKVVGVNIAKDMILKAQRVCKGLDVTFKCIDARHITGVYDRITCIGLLEHFGLEDIRNIFEAVHRCLTDDGIFLLETYSTCMPHVPICNGLGSKYLGMVFVKSYFVDLMKAMEGKFIIEDMQNIGSHWALTEIAMGTDKQKSEDIEARAVFALHSVHYAMTVRRNLSVFQLVLSKYGLIGGYNTVV